MERWQAEKGSKLAAARVHVHRLIDCRIEFGGEDRDAIYEGLAASMGIPKAECHVGMFTLAECELATIALRGWLKLEVFGVRHMH